MQIQIQRSEHDDELRFEVRGADVALLNALRRVIHADVPNVAVDFDPNAPSETSVVFHENTSSLHNEFLAHRLAMIPVCMREDEMPSCHEFTMSLQVKNNGSENVHVKTSDIVVRDQNGKERPELAARWFPRNATTQDSILITTLKPNPQYAGPGESLNVDFRCRVGLPRENAAFASVSVASFVNRIDPDIRAEKMRELGIDGGDADAVRQFDALDAQRCFRRNEHGEAAEFEFFVESTSGRRPEDIVSQALRILVQKIEKVDERAELAASPREGMHELNIRDEDHTLGNLLQSVCFKTLYAGGSVSFVGYNVPHPLENVVRMCIACTSDPMTVLRRTQANAIQMVKEFQAAWEAAWAAKQSGAKPAVKPRRAAATKRKSEKASSG